ncbi:SDR family oxidoreductase [Geomobilimonas luticola]|uniref:SDR family oxidoreductase n=1 Tax=Geomobilimonas luticola TaxID=1114878 RepID=A0ABS5SBG3_9BACT|nr:SDR family oxidoreductase [Geomobilimonas luticola]
MQLKGKIALVTGGNGGIGTAFVAQLLQREVSKVYATVRNADSGNHLKQLDPERVVVIELDITDEVKVEQVAKMCSDVNVLINNAGVNRGSWLMAPDGKAAARDELEANFFGTLNMCLAFAPVIENNGGGSIAIVCSLLGLVSMPVMGTYCVSKAALHSLIQGLRGELASKNISVRGIYPGPVDTKMADGVEMPKASPELVALVSLEGLENCVEDIFPDPMSQEVHTMLLASPKQVEKEFAKYVPA